MNRRLDSWKAIAEYLGRDAATARRWEKTLGLPIHRVAGGAGRSVFAYTDDIDAWLAAPDAPSSAAPAAAPAATADPIPAVAPAVESRPFSRFGVNVRRAFGAAAAIALLSTAWWATAGRAASAPLRVTVNERRIVAFDEGGAELWRHEFPAGTQTALPYAGRSSIVIGGTRPMVYVATSHRFPLPEGAAQGGELLAFDGSGRQLRTFAFDDAISMRGKTYKAPWVVTSFAITSPGEHQRIAVAAHEYMWSPSLVTVLDRDWRRGATWVHDGWIETLEWMAPDRLVAGGFEQEKDAGLIALLDTATMKPLKMVVMPRSELNTVTASRFNRAIVELVNGGVLARTVEMPDELSQGAIDGIYEFTPSLDLQGASYSSRYWEMHRSLEVQGRIRHPQSACPDRDGPREVLEWEPATGWRARAVRPVP